MPKNYIKFWRDAFATEEDWETLCEEVNVDPEEVYSIKINFDADEAEVEYEDTRG